MARSQKLKKEFNLKDTELESTYLLPFKITKEPKLIEFQFKIVNFIIGTNVFLKTVKIKENDLCGFCENSKETVKHLFYECTLVKRFWGYFEVYWYEKTNEPLKLSLNAVLLGDNQFSDMLNYFILVAKYYIFRAKYHQVLPRFKDYVAILKANYKIQKRSLFGKSVLFSKMWTFEP